ncbi:MAG: hypothetical protein ABEJ68_04350 [Halobacteriaceae archaeon]
MPATQYSEWTSGIVALGGLWAVATPYVVGQPRYAVPLNVTFGALLAVAAGYYAFMAASDEEPYRGASGLAVICGVGLVVTPFLIDAGTTYVMGNVVVGAVGALVHAYEVLSGAGRAEFLTGMAAS